MKLKERVMRRLSGQEVDVTPVGVTTSYCMVAFMKACGLTRPDVDLDPKALAQMAIAGHTLGGFEWIKAMGHDITIVSEALGCQVKSMSQDSTYVIASHPYAERSIDELDLPDDFLTKTRFPAYKEQFKLLRDIGKEVAIFGECEGPFTAAANLMDVVSMMKHTIRHPDYVQKALQVTTEAVIRIARFAAENGADYFCIAEPTSSPSLLSPRDWARFVSPCVKRIVKEIPIPLVLHICGNTGPILDQMCATGVAGISIEEKTDMSAALEIAHASNTRVFGNISTSSTLFNGTPEECYKESVAALEKGVDFLSPGCGVGPNSPLENIIQMRRARDAKWNLPEFTPAETVTL